MIVFCAFCVFFIDLFISLTYLMLFVRRHWAFGFWHYRYYYYYHDHKYVEHDSPDEGSPEDIGLLFTATDVSMRLSSSESK